MHLMLLFMSPENGLHMKTKNDGSFDSQIYMRKFA